MFRCVPTPKPSPPLFILTLGRRLFYGHGAFGMSKQPLAVIDKSGLRCYIGFYKTNLEVYFMRRFLLTLVAIVFAFTFFVGAGKALAGEGDVYGGVKAGIAFVDDSGSIDIDDLTMIGFLVGVGITPEISFEGEFNVSVAGGDIDYLWVSGDLDVWTLAGYAVYRAPISEEAFLKGKLGLLLENWEFSISGWGSESDTDLELSAGIGAGLYFSEKLFGEVEFTIIEEDISYLSVGLNYIF